MSYLLKPYSQLFKAVFVAVTAICVVAPSAVLAFDSQSVLKMHIKIENIQSEVKQIPTQDIDAINRIQAIELELNALRSRLQQYENKLNQSQLVDAQVLQRPLENPYSETAPLAPPPMMNSDMAQLAPQLLPEAGVAQELNTVPEALRGQVALPKPEAKAFTVTELPEGVADLSDGSKKVSNGFKTVVSLGSQEPDVMAFNEAKAYFDDAFYIVSERKFNQFIQYYRQSSLISNAYFWLGESYYQRKNYGAAAQIFYQGYRSNKKGAKAPDNLFKLATTLLLLGNKSDACSAYFEVGRRYSKSHPQLSNMAQAKQKEHACL